jgi:creatinine amidohydrolase
MKTRRPFVLSESDWKAVRDTEYDLAVLPWGATEAHNYHLPYATDTIQCEHIAQQAAERAWAGGVRAMVLPAVPFGVQSAQKKTKFTLHMSPSTQLGVLRDLVGSLECQGVYKLLLINGHGGNDFVPALRELYGHTKVMIFLVNWYHVVPAKRYFEEPGDHAGEMETSVMLSIAPHLVRSLEEAGAGRVRGIKVPSLREGWVWTQRGWIGETTQDGGMGDPSRASAAKGAAYLEAIISKLSVLLGEIAALDLEEIYEKEEDIPPASRKESL